MAREIAERFMRALQEAERTRNVDPLVELFAEDASAENPAREPSRGRDDVREFWTAYLDAFDRVASNFTNVSEGGNLAVLEWTSEGALASGQPISYRGVSILDTDGDAVRAFRTYYDTAAFLARGVEVGPGR